MHFGRRIRAPIDFRPEGRHDVAYLVNRHARSARQTRDLIASTTAKMTGKKRGDDRRVRRNSYDENDRRVRQLWRPINGGQKAAGMRWQRWSTYLNRPAGWIAGLLLIDQPAANGRST